MKTAIFVAVISAAAVWLFTYCLQPRHRREIQARAYASVIGLPLVAWGLHNPWLLHGLMLLWVPLVAQRPGQIVPVYLFSLLLLPGLDQTVSVGSLKLFEFGVHDGLVVGALIGLHLHPGRAKPPPQADIAAGAIVLLLTIGLSRDTTFSHLLRMGLNVVMDLGLPYLVVSRGIRSIDELRKAMLWLGCGALTLGAILMFEVWKAWPIYNELYGRYGLPTLILVKARAGLLRAGGPFVEPTSIAMVLSLCLVATWLSRSYFRTKYHHGLILVLSFAGLCAPQSRGAWVGLFLAVCIADLFRRRYLALIKKMTIALAAGTLIFAAAEASPNLAETLGLSGGSTQSADYRRHLLTRGMEEFRRSPLVGFSMPDLNDRLRDLRQGEGIIDYVNTYIWIMLLSGSIGLAVFIGPFLFFISKAWQAARLARSEEHALAAAFIISTLLMMMEMLFFTSFGTRPAYFVFITFGFAAAFGNLKKPRPRAVRMPSGHGRPAFAAN